MSADPKLLVAAGYDRIASAYLARHGCSAVRRRWLGRLADGLPARGGRVLDLGCGAGVPVALALAAAGHHVTGVDLSAGQIARARRQVPGATFIQADMAHVELAPAAFDAIGAFYALTHVPALEQGAMFRRIARWLRPGGRLVASLGAGPTGDWIGPWLGVTMFFGHNDVPTGLALLRAAGLVVERAEVERQDDEDAAFLWVVATRPPAP